MTPFLSSLWNHWDASVYIQVAKNGYSNVGERSFLIVFHPLMALIIRIFTKPFNYSLILIQILILILLFAGFYMFYKLIRQQFSKEVATWSIIFYSIFPTSFFLILPYPDALFLLLFSLAFYFANKKNWLISGTTAGLATITRPFGILIAPSLLLYLNLKDKQLVQKIIKIILPSLVTYLVYLYINKKIYGDPFAYTKILYDHWQKRFSFPIFGIFDSYKRMFKGDIEYRIFVGFSEFITSVIGWILVIPAWKKLSKPMAMFYTLSVFLMTSTSFILSTPRYLLSIPPFFILLSNIFEKKLLKTIWTLISLILLYCLIHRFLIGMWSF